MLQTKNNILKQLSENINSLRKYGVKRIGLFGSYVRNSGKPESDIDILVEFIPDAKTYDNFYDLIDFLEILFGTKVDLVTTESLSPFIGPEILKEVEYLEIAA